MLNRYIMQLGINQNISYRGELYHVQTEDGGRKNPVITTLLFKGGLILAAKRTAYADILKSDKLDIVVRELMDEQHESLVKALEEGRFDKGPEPREKADEKKEEAKKQTPLPGEGGDKTPPVGEKSLDDFILECLSLDK
jgi:hypothetical protein